MEYLIISYSMNNLKTLDYLRELTREGYPYGTIVQTAENDPTFLNDVTQKCSSKEEVAEYFYED